MSYSNNLLMGSFETLDLSSWQSHNTILTGTSFIVKPAGWMRQHLTGSVYGFKTPGFLTRFLYNLSEIDILPPMQTYCKVYVTYWDATDDSFVVPLKADLTLLPGNVGIEWLGLEQSLETEERQIQDVTFTIYNNSELDLLIRGTELLRNTSLDGGSNFDDMRDKSILYGLDIDKPVLR